jgi:MoaA/NifB/PqqE/SkfB family radical SAM enzyme
MEWFSSWRSVKLDWIQVEVSSTCNANCTYCPSSIYRDQEAGQIMEMKTFQRLEPEFSKTHMIHLQGWGEPFLNPKFFEMVQISKSSGLRVGTTTNGMCLDSALVEQIVKSGIDTVGLSLAGANSQNDVIRKGTRLEKVLAVLGDFHRIKDEIGTKKPSIHLAYMLLSSGLDELIDLPELLENLDVEQVVINTLDFVAAPELEKEQLAPENEEMYMAIKARLDLVAAAGEKRGVKIHYRLAFPREATRMSPESVLESDFLAPLLLSAGRQGRCTENILHSVFVSANGDVSPCVYSNIPAKQAMVMFSGNMRPYKRIVFGNINKKPLESIWRSNPYAAFRETHRRNALRGACAECTKPLLA